MFSELFFTNGIPPSLNAFQVENTTFIVIHIKSKPVNV
jgi:hypothetical protein